MQTRTYVSVLISSMVNAVIFGAGVVTVMTIPALAANAWFWIPVVVVLSFVVAPFIAWKLAPKLMQRYKRRREAMRTMPGHAAR
jgi:ABC-type sulfate transport system permease subunit